MGSILWLGLATAASAAPIQLSQIDFTWGVGYTTRHEGGEPIAEIDPNGYEASVRVVGANIESVLLHRPAGLATLDSRDSMYSPFFDSDGGEFAFFGAIDVQNELPAVESPDLPTDTYTIDFTGTMGDMLSITFDAVVPAMPDGMPSIVSPSPGAPTMAMTTLAWTCDGCMADELFVEVSDETLDEGIFEEFFPVGAGSVDLQPDPTHRIEYDVELSNLIFDSVDGVQLEQRYRVSNEVTTVPEPTSAALTALGLVGLAMRRRFLRSR